MVTLPPRPPRQTPALPTPRTGRTMFGRIALFFTIVTLVELSILIPLGNMIGLLWTLVLIVLTALIGAWVVQREGARALRRIREDLNAGRLPADALIDGLGVLVAGTLLATPGVLTDVVGLLIMSRVLRGPIRRLARARFERWLSSGASVGWMSNASFGEQVGFGVPPADFYAGHAGFSRRDGATVVDVVAEPREQGEDGGPAEVRRDASDPAGAAGAGPGVRPAGASPRRPAAADEPVYRDGDVIVVSRSGDRSGDA